MSSTPGLKMLHVIGPLLVTENAVSMYKSAKYIEKEQHVSAGVILYNRVSASVGSLAKPDHLF